MSCPPYRVVFMGTPSFSVPSLHSLLENPIYRVVGVYTQAPKPKGRGYSVIKSPVHVLARQHQIPVYTPQSLKSDSAENEFLSLESDLAIVVAYGMLLPKPILDIPKFGCVNVHASLLPRWRGAAPIQRSIIAGDKITGVSLMSMDHGLDTGPIIAMESLSIGPQTTTKDLWNSLAMLGANMLTQYLPSYLNGHLCPVAQPEKGVTLAPKIKKEEGWLKFSESAESLERKIRGMFPSPGTYLYYKGQRLKIMAATVGKKDVFFSSGHQNIIHDNQFGITCAQGILYPKIVQKPGGIPQDINSFLNGFSFSVGDLINQDVPTI